MSHFVHVNGFSPVWVLSCTFKLHTCEKLLSHFVHLNGFSPVWVLSCFFKLLEFEKLMSHFEHWNWNGFSLVWVLSCLFKALETEKLLTHFPHLNYFSLMFGPLMILQFTRCHARLYAPIVYSPSMYCRSPFIFLSFIW